MRPLQNPVVYVDGQVRQKEAADLFIKLKEEIFLDTILQT